MGVGFFCCCCFVSIAARPELWGQYAKRAEAAAGVKCIESFDVVCSSNHVQMFAQPCSAWPHQLLAKL